jgi:hypothetical protein
VGDAGEREVFELEAEGGGQVEGGILVGQASHGGPEVEDVSGSVARGVEALEDPFLGVDGETAIVASIVVMDGAEAAELRGRTAEVVPRAQVPEDLFHGDLLAQRPEVDPARRRAGAGGGGRRRGVLLAGAGRLAGEASPFAGGFQFAIAFGMDHRLQAEQFVGGRDIAESAVQTPAQRPNRPAGRAPREAANVSWPERSRPAT